MVVESEGTKARLVSTHKQLDLLLYENQLFNFLLDQSGQFDIASLPEPPELIRSEERTRSVQLTVQETSARLALLRTRLASQQRTLLLKQELVDSLRPSMKMVESQSLIFSTLLMSFSVWNLKFQKLVNSLPPQKGKQLVR